MPVSCILVFIVSVREAKVEHCCTVKLYSSSYIHVLGTSHYIIPSTYIV